MKKRKKEAKWRIDQIHTIAGSSMPLEIALYFDGLPMPYWKTSVGNEALEAIRAWYGLRGHYPPPLTYSTSMNSPSAMFKIMCAEILKSVTSSRLPINFDSYDDIVTIRLDMEMPLGVYPSRVSFLDTSRPPEFKFLKHDFFITFKRV